MFHVAGLVIETNVQNLIIRQKSPSYEPAQAGSGLRDQQAAPGKIVTLTRASGDVASDAGVQMLK